LQFILNILSAEISFVFKKVLFHNFVVDTNCAEKLIGVKLGFRFQGLIK
jgi:hypothetical protein